MIIGVGKKKRVTEVLHGTECPFCKAKDTIVAEGYQQFFVLGLPMFPSGKIVEFRCGQCKKFFSEHAAPYPFANMGMDLKQRIKPALWMFAFPLIVAILLPLALIKESVTASENIGKIKNAHKGDVYTIKVGERLYQKMRIEKVNGDTISFYTSLNGPDRLSSLGTGDVFAGDELVYTKQKLLEKNDEHDITAITQNAASPD